MKTATDGREAELNNLCAAAIDGMRRFYADPRNVERFEAWKRHKEEKQKHD